MKLKKDSLKADAVANLYRAAFYMAKGATKTGIDFFEKAKARLGLNQIGEVKTRRQQLYWAEKILDQYQKLKSVI